MSESGQLKKTAKHSAIYAIGTMLRRLTGLIMLPIYTRYLTPSDYGVVELLTMAIEISSILIGLRIVQAMFRYYSLAESQQEKNEVVSTVLLTIMMTSGVGASLLYVYSNQLSFVVFGSSDYVIVFQLFVFTLTTNAVAEVGLGFLRAQQKPILFVIISITSLIVQVLLNIYFVVMQEMHVAGVVYSSLISGLIIASGLSIYVFLNVGIHYSPTFAKRLFKFVAPLIAASIGAFYVAYADKYFLRIYGGLAEVGLYALAARVTSVIGTVYEAFNMSWQADRFEVVKKDNAKQIFRQVFHYLSAAIVVVGAGLAAFAGDFFRIMTSPEFYTAGFIVPVLIVSSISRIYTMFCNFSALYTEQTGTLAKASWIKVGVATVSYFLLIPSFGVYGAAIALSISNTVELVWVYLQSKKQYDMGLAWQPVLIMLAAATVFVSSCLIMPVGEIEYFAARVVLYLGFLLTLYFLPIWECTEREMIREVCANIVSFKYVRNYVKR